MVNNVDGIIGSVLNNGFCFRSRFSPEMTTEQVVQALGEAALLKVGTPVHTLAPKRMDEAPSNTYSGNYGLGTFPLHTDLANWHEPPRFLMLRCVHGTPDVATTLFDPKRIINEIGIENLARALMKPRRRVAGRMSLLPIANLLRGEIMIRWDERYLEPASRLGALCFTQISKMLAAVVVKEPVPLRRPQFVGAAPIPSQLDLLGNAERVIDLDSEISDSALQLRMPQQKLHRPEVAGL